MRTKSLLLTLLRRVLQAPRVRDLLGHELHDVFSQHYSSSTGQMPLMSVPDQYKRDDCAGLDERPALKERPIFITARFRSGSTFLWNIFRTLEGVTAYYEPLNENRWFLPRSGSCPVDPTHIGISNYSQEYQGMEDLNQYFSEHWTYRNLFMGEHDHDPKLYRYIQNLIDRASGRPVLQFNRMDFRLPWLRAYFPEALIVHLYRDPRDQWMSVQGKCGPVPTEDADSSLLFVDQFYIQSWANDLRRVFPFLDPASVRHPYSLHYYLWRLSYSLGQHYSNISLCYEKLVNQPREEMARLFTCTGIETDRLDHIENMITRSGRKHWNEYADDDWYREKERECDRILTAFFSDTTNP